LRIAMEHPTPNVGTQLPQAAAEAALQPLLDAYAKQKRSAQQLTAEFVAICTQQPAATWEALSLLDRYHRRKVIASGLFRDMKKALNAIAFGGSGHALSAPGPEDSQTHWQDATQSHTQTAYSREQSHTAQLHTAQLNTAHLRPGSSHTQHLHTSVRQEQPDSAHPKTEHLPAGHLQTERLRRTSEQTAHFKTPDEQTAYLDTLHSQPADTKTAHLHTDSSPSNDGIATHFYSNTELNPPVGAQPRDATLPRTVQTQQRDAGQTYSHQTRSQHTQSGRTQSGRSVAEVAALTQATLAQSPSLRPGTVLMNRYVLVEPLSNGGIGVVFKALDQQRAALPEAAQDVAIKCLHEQLQNEPRAIAALRHEYRQSQLLSHPNIAKVYDFHQADGISFLALELVDGDSLGRICERIAPRRLPPSRALAIVREVGMALAHAHEQGILHGNLHPNNVVITRLGQVRVREFGQATAWLESVTPADDELRDMPPSSPELRYRSPQQKNAIPADAADDIYSLACIAYELLCGRTPDAALGKVGARKPGYARHLSAERWQALQHGLADDRSLRGNDVRKWLGELNLSGAAIRLPSIAELESQLFGGERWFDNRAVLAGAAAACVAIVGVIAWSLWPASDTDQESSTAEVIEPANTGAITSEAERAAPADSSPSPSGSITQLTSPEEVVERPPVSNNVVSSSSQSLSSSGLPTVSFSQARYEIPADADVATLTIRRRGASNTRLTLQWFSIEGSAKSDVDYVRDGNTSVHLAAGQSSADIVIPLIKGEPRDRAAWFDVRIRATTDALPGDAVLATVYLMPTLTSQNAP
jgi:serine/threonine protein kinase